MEENLANTSRKKRSYLPGNRDRFSSFRPSNILGVPDGRKIFRNASGSDNYRKTAGKRSQKNHQMLLLELARLRTWPHRESVKAPLLRVFYLLARSLVTKCR
jgi:hypothetical protein